MESYHAWLDPSIQSLAAFFSSTKPLEIRRAQDKSELFLAVCDRLYRFILELPEHEFALPIVLKWLAKVEDKTGYRLLFSDFERWLNLIHPTSATHQRMIREKVTGTWLPPRYYQACFPIGMGKRYPGLHLVTGHSAPDLDTTVTSFWSWLDAFYLGLGSTATVWNLPGGGPSLAEHDRALFVEELGEEALIYLPMTMGTLALFGWDQVEVAARWLIDQPLPGEVKDIYIAIDGSGFYRGAVSRSTQQTVLELLTLVEVVCDLSKKALAGSQGKLLDSSIQEVLSDHNRQHFVDFITPSTCLDRSLQQLFGLSKGIHASCHDLINVWKHYLDRQTRLSSAALDSDWNAMKQKLHALLRSLDFVAQLQLLADEKIGEIPYDTSEEGVKSALESYTHLVVFSGKGPQLAWGVITRSLVETSIRATLSLRDFCNRQEVVVPDSWAILSVIDHHKGQLKISHPASVYLSDAQACSAMVAYQQRLIRSRAPSMVSTRRIAIEDRLYLAAILDDTDALAKVSSFDLEVVQWLLEELLAIQGGGKLSPPPYDPMQREWVALVRRWLLQQPMLHALYSHMFLIKETLIKRHIAAIQGPLPQDGLRALLTDTKLQGCARVGQLKLTPPLFPDFLASHKIILREWLLAAQSFTHLLLHIQMISTVEGTEQVYYGSGKDYTHFDELWIAAPASEVLPWCETFLVRFLRSGILQGSLHSVECNAFSLKILWERCSQLITSVGVKTPLLLDDNTQNGDLPPYLRLRFTAGRLNSRKTAISPYLPTL